MHVVTSLCAQVLKPAMLAAVTLMYVLATSTSSVAAEAKILVAYFSGTGTTAAVATKLATKLGADLYQIKAQDDFTAEDLSYDPKSRSNQEKDQPALRPELADHAANVAAYDTVLLGYPIWNNVAPRVVATFVESYDFSDKDIVPFCTAYSSGIENSVTELRNLYPALKIDDGQKFSQSYTEQDIDAWVEVLKRAGKVDK